MEGGTSRTRQVLWKFGVKLVLIGLRQQGSKSCIYYRSEQLPVDGPGESFVQQIILFILLTETEPRSVQCVILKYSYSHWFSRFPT